MSNPLLAIKVPRSHRIGSGQSVPLWPSGPRSPVCESQPQVWFRPQGSTGCLPEPRGRAQGTLASRRPSSSSWALPRHTVVGPSTPLPAEPEHHPTPGPWTLQVTPIAVSHWGSYLGLDAVAISQPRTPRAEICSQSHTFSPGPPFATSLCSSPLPTPGPSHRASGGGRDIFCSP